jgi:hypothetical protein
MGLLSLLRRNLQSSAGLMAMQAYQPAATAVSPASAVAAQPAMRITPSVRAVVDPNSKRVFVEDTSIADGLRRKAPVEDADATPILNATAQDHEDWLRERARGNPTHRRPGMTVRQEYEQWLTARFKARAARHSLGAGAAAR